MNKSVYLAMHVHVQKCSGFVTQDIKMQFRNSFSFSISFFINQMFKMSRSNKSIGFELGDRGDQGWGPFRTIQRFGYRTFKYC